MPPSRIDELRRRVQNDPASIAFAQLAEEYRRSGQTEEAVRVCRDGLTRHPGYLSARVTLGRALLDLAQLSYAREELEFVVAEAPENLAAVRGLAEICHRDGQPSEALSYYQRALALARHDPEIEEIVRQLSRQVGAAAARPSAGSTFDEAHEELLAAGERVPVAEPESPALHGQDLDHGSTAPFDFDRLVASLATPSAPPHTEAELDGRQTSAPIDLSGPEPFDTDPFAALEADLRAHETPATGGRPAPWPAVETDFAAQAFIPDLTPVSRDAGSALELALADLDREPQSAADVLADTLLGDAFDPPADGADDPAAQAVRDPFAAIDPADAAVVALAAEPLHSEGQPDVRERSSRAPGADAPAAHAPATHAPEGHVPGVHAPGTDAPGARDTRSAASGAERARADEPPPPEAVALFATAALEAASPGPPPGAAVPAAQLEATQPPSPEGVLDDLESWLKTLHGRTIP